MTSTKLPQLGAGGLIALALGVVAAAPRAVFKETGAPRPVAAIVFVQTPLVAAGTVDRFPKGSRLVLLSPARDAGKAIALTPEFFAARDPQVSFDGKRILFSARKARRSRWQIWEMNADGAAKRQITRCAGDCVGPAYLARGEFVYTEIASRDSGANSRVFAGQLDGSDARPITFGPGDFRAETVLRDGRILISASSPLADGPGAARSRQLYTVRLDGTALQAFRCDHRERAVRGQATELVDGSLLFVKARDGSEAGGALAIIRRGASHNAGLTGPEAVYLDPRANGARNFIVARKDLSARGGAASKYDLYDFDPAREGFAERLYGDARLSSVQAVPLAARPAPRWFWSIVKPEAESGYFICLNSYLSSDAPRGRSQASIARVRVLTLDPQSQRERELGTAPVEKDGSFYVTVPPDRPMRFELLNGEGQVIRAQRSWIWTRPGEEAACVGCHEDKATAPPNRWPQVLRRLDTPVHVGAETPAQ